MSITRIGEAELRPLPRWARVALALRCLRRARGLVCPPAPQAQVLDEALARIQYAVETGHAGDDLADAAAAAYTLALDNLDAPPSSPTQADRDVSTCMVAHATAFAAEAATLTDPRQAAHLVAQSADFAIHAYRLAAAADTSSALAGMRADLELLLTASGLRADLERLRSASGWSDNTPVPAEFFPPL
jgi:hypothetical protein